MKQTLESYTTQAITCLDNASKITHALHQTRITPDTLFWGIDAFLKQSRHFPLFCAVIGLKKTKALESIFLKEIQVPMLQSKTKLLPFNKILASDYSSKIEKGQKNIDPFQLFILAFERLSPKIKKLIQKDKNNL